jgi:hypothetical protein
VEDVEATAPAHDEPLFVDDMSDFDMDEILGSEKEPTKTGNGEDPSLDDLIQKNEPEIPEDVEFADEMDAMHDLDDF